MMYSRTEIKSHQEKKKPHLEQKTFKSKMCESSSINSAYIKLLILSLVYTHPSWPCLCHLCFEPEMHKTKEIRVLVSSHS